MTPGVVSVKDGFPMGPHPAMSVRLGQSRPIVPCRRSRKGPNVTWHLIVKTIHGEHLLFIGGKDAAEAALSEVQKYIGGSGTVRIGARLTLRAEDITAGQIFERHVEPNPRRR